MLPHFTAVNLLWGLKLIYGNIIPNIIELYIPNPIRLEHRKYQKDWWQQHQWQMVSLVAMLWRRLSPTDNNAFGPLMYLQLTRLKGPILFVFPIVIGNQQPWISQWFPHGGFPWLYIYTPNNVNRESINFIYYIWQQVKACSKKDNSITIAYICVTFGGPSNRLS